MLYLKLDATEYRNVSQERDPDVEWSHESTESSWVPHKITVSDKDSWKALGVDFDIKPGDVVHCVYAICSTGSSFNHNAGGELEVVSYHKSAEVAIRNRDALTACTKGNSTVTIEFDSGTMVDRCCPGDSYFESLDYVDIFTAIVQHE